MTLDLTHLRLDRGAHNTPEDGACVMEAAAYIKGLPWSEAPDCTSPVIGAFLRSWNDALPDDERQQLDRYLTCTTCDTIHASGPANTEDHEPVVPLLDTAAPPKIEVRRAWMATDWLVRVQSPAWLRLAGLQDQADLLAGMAEVTPESCPSILPTLKAVVRRKSAGAWDAAGAAARYAAWAAWAAARDAAGAAAGDAAGDAAWAAARDAAAAAAWAAASAPARGHLEPTKVELQASAHDLIERMIGAT
jgi:hypothetical protein